MTDTVSFDNRRPRSLRAILVAPAARLRDWSVRMTMAGSRRGAIDALMGKSDTELAQMGLSRQGIYEYVYRDRLGL